MLNIEEKKFYAPKIMICALVLMYLVTETAYVTIKDAELMHPYLDNVRLALRMVGLFILSAYLIYFAIVSFMVIKVLSMMKKSYKWLICVTLAVIFTSIIILFLNG